MHQRLVALCVLTFSLIILGSLSAQSNSVELISVATSGTTSGNNLNRAPNISSDGCLVVYDSFSTNLVTNDTNSVSDVFLYNCQTGSTTRASLTNGGAQANSSSGQADISANGRFVAFDSIATNLVSGDTNVTADIFVRDLQNGQNERVSFLYNGAQTVGVSVNASISADGRYVAFESESSFIVSSDNNLIRDIFVRDRQTDQNIQISVSSTGVGGNWDSFLSVISDDGRFVAFMSEALNLVTPPLQPSEAQVFVHEIATGITTLVSQSTSGSRGYDYTAFPSISADGRYIAFESESPNLVPGDTNQRLDVFVRDRVARTTTRVSLSSTGVQGNRFSYSPSISADGTYVAFVSSSTNLVPNDTNNLDDIFIHNRLTGDTVMVTLNSSGAQADGISTDVQISSDGRYITFLSDADNLSPLVELSRLQTFTAPNPIFGLPLGTPIINLVTRLPMTLTWTRVSWALRYEVRVDETPSFSTPLAFTTTTTALQTTITTLPDGFYHWQVRAIDSAGNPGPWSATQTFTLDAVP